MPTFHIHSESTQNGIPLLTVKGFLDAHTYEELEKAIHALFAKKVYRFVVDLSGLDYISSAGAGVFIGAVGTAQENEGEIALVKPSPNVKEVFDLLGLSQIFKFSDTREGAIKMLG